MRVIYFIIFLLLYVISSIHAEDAGQLFQKGLFAEHGTGDIEAAIKLYEQAFQQEYEDDELAAIILLHLGACYEKVGRDGDARDSYQQIIWRFPGQDQIIEDATKRMQRLSSGLTGDGYWFRYKGQPIYLIGGGTTSIYAGSGLSAEMSITEDPVGDWIDYIDLLVQYGINFVRFYPWDFLQRSKMPDYACPWVVLDDKPVYDLNSFSPDYWKALKQIISYANRRDVLFEIVLFDDDSPWEKNPFNRKHGGALEDRKDYHDLSNGLNREYQEKYVAKTVAETVEFPVVIYEICDAVGWRGQPLSRSTRNWLMHWISFIEKRFPPSSNHPITVSRYAGYSDVHDDALWNFPGMDIISLHENGGAKYALARERTHKRFLKNWQADYRKPMMINSVSFGDMSGHPSGGTRGWSEERQHFWMAFTSGGHASRSDFQPFIATHPSLDFCLNFSNFIRYVSFWEMNPLANFVVKCDGRFYSLSSDKEFIVYIRDRKDPKGGSIRLKLPEGSYKAQWYDPVNGTFLPDAEISGGSETELVLPNIPTDLVFHALKARGE